MKIKKNILINKLEEKINFNNTNISEFMNLDILEINIFVYDLNWTKVFLNKKNDNYKFNISDLSIEEWNHNKIHLQGNIDNFDTIYILWREIFKLYYQKLSRNFTEKFILSLSTDYWENPNIVLRFYAYREEELPIISENIDDYNENWMLIWYVNF